jgi:hypothetical protein
MSFFNDFGQSWLAGQITANCAQAVTYTRQGAGSVTVQAVIGRTAFRVDDTLAQRSRLEWADLDFLIDQALLVIGGVTITPTKGDRIAPGVAPLLGKTYEVQPVNGEPAARFSDPFGNKWRIHCKRVS